MSHADIKTKKNKKMFISLVIMVNLPEGTARTSPYIQCARTRPDYIFFFVAFLWEPGGRQEFQQQIHNQRQRAQSNLNKQMCTEMAQWMGWSPKKGYTPKALLAKVTSII